MYDFQSSFYAMIAGLRGYVSTKRPGFKFEYQANQDVNTQAWKTIQSKKDLLTPSQIDSLGKIESARDEFLLLPPAMFEAVEGPNARMDLRLFSTEAVPLSDRLLGLLDRQAGFQQELLQSELNTGREQLATAQVITIVSAVIVILAGLLVAFAIANDIARPILRLTDVAQTIKSGDLTARATVTSQDEIGILADTFNSMTSNLQYTLDSLRVEQEKSENLLLNILPREIAELLKNKPDSIAQQYGEASILFADVVNFTPMSSQMTPIELVQLLNKVFSQFDNLVEKYDLEKIKTIGDCYMVASGVPRPRQDHARVITQLALDMQEIVKESEYFGRKLTFRIGINSGPVIAGVIGRKKFIYDLWGDAVNTASRMESNGMGGFVQVTYETYNLIHDEFICESRGIINVKGKGELPVWLVRGKK
jgi:class 3 adenylate cyclase